ncbi:hypothetical protein V7S43_014729 [Phytophthora oleae]|uniref:Uncharacterized protein n=1 Tax=Phytophthora oleae TaxID=2107226 RepID=A0ABD3F0B1_9STRA
MHEVLAILGSRSVNKRAVRTKLAGSIGLTLKVGSNAITVREGSIAFWDQGKMAIEDQGENVIGSRQDHGIAG